MVVALLPTMAFADNSFGITFTETSDGNFLFKWKPVPGAASYYPKIREITKDGDLIYDFANAHYSDSFLTVSDTEVTWKVYRYILDERSSLGQLSNYFEVTVGANNSLGQRISESNMYFELDVPILSAPSKVTLLNNGIAYTTAVPDADRYNFVLYSRKVGETNDGKAVTSNRIEYTQINLTDILKSGLDGYEYRVAVRAHDHYYKHRPSTTVYSNWVEYNHNEPPVTEIPTIDVYCDLEYGKPLSNISVSSDSSEYIDSWSTMWYKDGKPISLPHTVGTGTYYAELSVKSEKDYIFTNDTKLTTYGSSDIGHNATVDTVGDGGRIIVFRTEDVVIKNYISVSATLPTIKSGMTFGEARKAISVSPSLSALLVISSADSSAYAGYMYDGSTWTTLLGDSNLTQYDSTKFEPGTEFTVSLGLIDFNATFSKPKITVNKGNATNVDVSTSEGSATIVATYVTEGSTVLKGDVNGDGSVSNADLVMMARNVVGLISLTDAQKTAADMNNDGSVSNADIVALARILVA